MVARLRKWFAWYKDRWAARLLIVPLILTIPPLALAAGQMYPPLGGFFDSHPLLALLCAFWPIWTIVTQAIAWVLDVPPHTSPARLLTLLKILNGILGPKIARCGELIRGEMESGLALRAGRGLLAVTEPDQQIEKTVAGVYLYFYSEARELNVDINVALAVMGTEYIKSWLCYHPGDYIPASPVHKLQVEHCGFSRAKQKRHIIVIESTKEESRKPVHKRSVAKAEELADDRSIIYMPVVHRILDDVPYVLRIVASRPRYFKSDKPHIDSYEYILSMFSDRILLEHGLKLLKERAVNEQDPAEHAGR